MKVDLNLAGIEAEDLNRTLKALKVRKRWVNFDEDNGDDDDNNDDDNDEDDNENDNNL